MENVRIAILSNENNVIGYLDNQAPGALHYYNDVLHTYLQGTASTFEFTTSTNGNSWFSKLKIGNKLSFRYRNRDYYFNIMTVEQTEDELTVTAMSCCLELITEEAQAYSAESAMKFTDYLTLFDPGGVLTVGKNEIKNETRTLSWDSESTQLERIYSLASEFDAEVEIRAVLNDDYTLSAIKINIYHEHDDDYQGIGVNRQNGQRVRYGVNLDGITKTSDITELYTSILATGKDDITLADYSPTSANWKQTDDDGTVLYHKDLESAYMCADSAMKKFPSHVTGSGDKYILYRWETEYGTQEKLFKRALSKLKKISQPQVTYDIDSNYANVYFGGIGDTVTVIDEEFEPALYLEARIAEQEISFTDHTKDKTTFTNIEVLKKSVISAEVQEQIANAKSIAVAANANVKAVSSYFWADSAGTHASDTASATSGKNMLLDSDGITLKDGDTELAKFTDSEIKLGENSISSAVKMCKESFTFHVKEGTHVNTAYIESNGDLFMGCDRYVQVYDGSGNSIDIGGGEMPIEVYSTGGVRINAEDDVKINDDTILTSANLANLFVNNNSAPTDPATASTGFYLVAATTDNNMPDTSGSYWLLSFLRPNGSGMQFASSSTKATKNLYMRKITSNGVGSWFSIPVEAMDTLA